MDEINACDTVITYDDDKSIDDIKVLQNNGHKVIYLGKGHNDLTMIEAADIAVAVGEDCTGDAVNLGEEDRKENSHNCNGKYLFFNRRKTYHFDS